MAFKSVEWGAFTGFFQHVSSVTVKTFNNSFFTAINSPYIWVVINRWVRGLSEIKFSRIEIRFWLSVELRSFLIFLGNLCTTYPDRYFKPSFSMSAMSVCWIEGLLRVVVKMKYFFSKLFKCKCSNTLIKALNPVLAIRYYFAIITFLIFFSIPDWTNFVCC